MFGFHMQGAKDNWKEALPMLPAGTPFLSVNDAHMLRDAKAVNPGLRTVFRKYWDYTQQPFSTDYEAMKTEARRYFDSFIDGTWMQQELWAYVDYVKELNEYVATSQNEGERQAIITWLEAVNNVWNTEYRGTEKTGYADIPLVCVSAAIGNDIDPRFARIVYAHDNVLSYHNYTHFIDGVRDPQDWRYHSGRWVYMDEEFRKQGIYVKWMSTEGGPYMGVLEGWKHPQVLNGDTLRYINECIQYQYDNVTVWNELNGGRYLGGVLFTVGNDPTWRYYDHTTEEMKQLAAFVGYYAPEPPPPPPPPPPPEPGTWQEEVWQESVNRQAISLNPTAAIQAAIFADGYTPVQSEFWAVPSDGVERACMAAEHLQTGERRVYYAVVPHWDNVQWFTDPKA